MSLPRMTLIEWLVLAVIVVILVALLIPGGRSAGSGSFELKVTVRDEPEGDCKVRWGLIRHERFRLAAETDEEDVVSWYSDLPKVDGPESYRIHYDVFGRQTWTGWKYKTVYPFDTVLVEYTLPDGSRRYRGIPINRQKGQRHVTIEVPPDLPAENTLIVPLPVDQ